ncbi:MAG: hypothetical protein HDT14_08480 [Oscillibacter sp.]|nr:hypothetical protein [Oscillibacter sp.]
MKKDVSALAPFLILLALDFYLLPLLAGDTGSAMLLMLCVMPLIALVSAVAYGVRRGFCPALPIAAFLLFIPAIFMYYNSSAWVYPIAYGVIVLIGNGAGRFFYQKR